MVKQRLESEIQRDILSWLEAQNITHWRVPLSGVFHNTGGKSFFKPNNMAGHPDIAGLINGRYFAIEVKRPKGAKWSPKQHLWRAKLEAAGATYIVATCVEDVAWGLNAAAC